MATKITPIDDGQIEPGHVTECAGCGCRGVYCDTDTGIVDADGAEIGVDLGDLPALLVGRSDGTDTDGLYCDACAAAGLVRCQACGEMVRVGRPVPAQHWR